MPDTSGPGTVSLSSRVRYRAVGGDGVLVHLDNGRVIVVNEVGLYVLEHLDKPANQKDLAASVAGAFDVTVDQAAADLDAFLDELDEEQILEQGA